MSTEEPVASSIMNNGDFHYPMLLQLEPVAKESLQAMKIHVQNAPLIFRKNINTSTRKPKGG